MARDLDFGRRKPTSPRPVAPKPNTPPPTSPPAIKPLPTSVISPERLKKKSKLPTWIWLVVILLVVAWGIFFYFISLRPSAVSQKPASNTAAAATKDSANTLLGSQATSSELQVTLYNSGAGSDAVEQLAKELGSHGYQSQNLGESQFQLDQTYIWYQKEYLADVQKIQDLLGDKKVALRPYVGANPYKILIQLGP